MKNLLFGLVILFSCFAAVSAQTVEASKVDEFGNSNCEVYMGRWDIFLTQLNNNPDAKAHIFVYTGKLKNAVFDKDNKFLRDEFILPRKNDAEEVITLFKRQIAFRNFDPQKFVSIKAGFRENFTVEFWLVPEGASPPKTTPTLEKMKQRKAKHYPMGLCGEL